MESTDLPEKLSVPALRALHSAGITSLAQLATHSEKEILAFHGMGPGSLPTLRAALLAKGLAFTSYTSLISELE